MKTRLTLAMAMLVCASLGPAIAELRLGSQAFAKQCIKCADEAMSRGRSVGGFCPSDCADVYANQVCASSGENCRPGSRANDRAAPSTGGGSGAALDVPVMEEGGDGFLAVRSGPGSRYRKLAELHNGDQVIIFEKRGQWAGIVCGTSNVGCSATKTRPMT